MSKILDFTGMSAADALDKAHAEFPEVGFLWERPYILRADGTTGEMLSGCPAALLAYAMGYAQSDPNDSGWGKVGEAFPHIPSGAGNPDDGWMRAAEISDATRKAGSFAEAADMLRARGW